MTPSPDPNEEKPRRIVQSFYKEFAPYLTLGFQLAAGVVLFFFIGRWVDGQLDTSPVFMLVGIFLGTIGGLIKFAKTVQDLSKKNGARGA